MRQPRLRWISEELFEIAGQRFIATPSDFELRSKHGEFVILKDRAMIELELALVRGRVVRCILDIGIWGGGSVALYDLALRPQKLVAIEYSSEPAEPLGNYIAKHKRTENVRLHYGVNQGDAERMNAILADEFGDQDIDLVIDDASHFYEETRTAFNAVFPYLGAGAHYIIEDWGWAHESTWTIPYFKDKPAQTNLVVELLALVRSRPDLVAKIEVFPQMVIVTKGDGEVARGAFDLREFATSRGRPIEPLL